MCESNDSSSVTKQVLLVPPVRFGFVNPGVIRGAYPTLRNFRFLSRLQLKTIVSLTPEPPTQDLVLFAEMAGIKLVHFPISRMTSLTDSVQLTLISALNICIEAKSHPVYIHCLDGRRITSLLVLLLRRVQGWAPLACLTEYWRYQVTFRSPVPTLEVEKTSRELEVFAAQMSDVLLPESLPKWLWGGDRSASVVIGVSFKTIQPATTSSTGTGSISGNNYSNSGNTLSSGSNGNPPNAPAPTPVPVPVSSVPVPSATVGSAAISASAGNVGNLATTVEATTLDSTL